ncbi:type VI secretion system protein ImpL [Sphingomonas trueperi]|uniref:type VI secretion system membrane subunit TssM n=1 Tax=Sphingomonas trueperi TaxID=53317 RepID=UPI003395B1F7
MQKLMRNWMAVSASAAAILALIILFGLPTLFPLFRATWIRLALVGLVALGFGLAVLWRWWRGKRAADGLADGLAATDAEDGAEETRTLAARMREALAELKSLSGSRRAYLYDRPWYVIIGPPGAGKTTALVHSGLRFPWAKRALKGVGGTRNLDFWFADEAVLVDTAGRYTTQDADAGTDAAGWRGFLDLLRRHRPLQPINGILVALATDMLTSADRAVLDAHAAAIRQRLAELRRTLQVDAPVYLLLPKADLLAGFTDFFGDLSAEGRRAVLGATLEPDSAADGAQVAAEFDRVVQALWQRLPRRLHEEPDAARRARILAFPAQMASLRQRLVYLVEGAFLADGDGAGDFRGFYFASGVQEGATLDRVLSAMAAVYDAPQPPAREGQGRAYFLNRLLTEVVIPEAGLVRSAPAVQRRRRGVLAGVFGGMVLLVVAMSALWAGSFARNKALQADLAAQAQSISGQIGTSGIDLVEVRASDPDLEQVLPLLDRLRALPRGFADQAQGDPSWRMRLGLFQSGHAATARGAYLEGVQRILLPRLLLRLEQVLRADAETPAALYEPLKVYLMLGGQGPLDPRAVRAWAVADWRTGPLAGDDRADIRADLARHLDAMLADPDLGRVWPNRRAPLDGALIASTRAAVQTLSLADRAYAELRTRAAASGRPDWQPGGVLASGDAQAFRGGNALLAAQVPWFFTREGYAKAYRPGLADVQAELGNSLWVLGPDAARQSIREQLPALRAAVAAAYARDYVAAWDGLLAQVQPADYFGSPAALGAFTRTPSPLKVLLQDVARNTRLGSEGGQAGDAGGTITAHFADLARYAGEGSGPAPVDALVDGVRKAASARSAASVAGASLGSDAAQGQLAVALGDLTTSSASAPPQLQDFARQATRSGASAAAKSAQTALGTEYARDVLPACLAATRGRYPFAPGAPQDAALAEVQQVFGMGGMLDRFVQQRLLALLDLSGPVWRWKSGDPVAASFAASSAAQFQKAAAIRALLAGGIAVNVGLAQLGPEVRAVQFAAGGASYRFDAATRDPKPVLWSASALPSASLQLSADQRILSTIETRGSWALFRLVDRARVANAGPSTLRLGFGEGAQATSLTMVLPGSESPFGRGGPFAFRCPERL